MTTILFETIEDYKEANERLTEHFRHTWDANTIRYASETPSILAITLNVGDEAEALLLLNGISFTQENI